MSRPLSNIKIQENAFFLIFPREKHPFQRGNLSNSAFSSREMDHLPLFKLIKTTERKVMWYQPGFHKILEDKIRLHESEPKSPTQTSQDPANLAYLMGQIPKFHFQKRAHYPKMPRVLTLPSWLSEHEKLAYRKFFEWGAPLSPRFSREELKAAFRKLALTFHPDQGGPEEQFLELRKMFLILKESIK